VLFFSNSLSPDLKGESVTIVFAIGLLANCLGVRFSLIFGNVSLKIS
jgi:hypothetical protein